MYSERTPTAQTLPTIERDDLIPSPTVDLRDVERACSRRPQLLRFFHRVEGSGIADRIGLLFSASSQLSRLAFEDTITFNQALGALEHLATANGAIRPSGADGSVDPADPVLVRLQKICARAYLEHSGAANRSLIRRELDRLRTTFAGASEPDFQAANEASERIAKGMAVSWGAEAFAVTLDDDTWPTPSSILPRTIAASVMGVFSAFWATPEDKALWRECMLIARRTIYKQTRRRTDLEFAAEAAPASQGPTTASIVLPTTTAPAIILPETLAKVVADDSSAETVSFPKPEPRNAEKPEEALARKLDALTHPPGLVGDIVDWIEGSSRNPNRILALGAALTWVGSLAGRLFEGPTGVRTNLYVTALAPTGFGKEHARFCIKQLAAESNLMRYIGGSQIMSATGLRNKVEKQPTLVYLIDEFAQTLRTWGDARSGAHVTGIQKLLLEYVGSAQSSMDGADYADGRGQVVYNPNVSLYGTTTPEDFWDALTTMGIANGFLPRFVIMVACGPAPETVDPVLSRDPPAHLVDACRRLVSVKPLGGNIVGSVMDGTTKLKARKVPWAGDAGKLFNDMESRCKATAAAGNAIERAMWTRVPVAAQTMALIVAIGRDCDEPEIWPQDLEWAFELVSLCTSSMVRGAEGRIAENNGQREYQFVSRIISDAGASGVTKTVITKKVQGRFDTKRIGMILAQLEEAGDILTTTVQNPNGGPIQHRYIRRDTTRLAA